MRTLLVDNYDSYTYNLFQLLGVVNGEEPLVVKNDEVSWADLRDEAFDNVVISPGPGRPDVPADFGVCREVVRFSTVPVLGVCLGHQGIGVEHGATLRHSPRIFHGEVSRVRHDGDPLFAGIPEWFSAVRYHSYVVDPGPSSPLRVTAWTEDGLVMGLRHVERPLWGIQFHPESVCTEHGERLLANFRDLTPARRGARRRPAPVPAPAPPPAAPWVAHATPLPRWREPEDVFRALVDDHPTLVWLDSSSAAAGRGRFSYLGVPIGPASHVATYDVASRTLTVERSGGSDRVTTGLFEHLSRVLDDVRTEAPAGVPFDFVGGYVAALGYELKAECGSPNRHRSPYPDALLVFLDRVLVFDHEERRAYAVALTRRGGPAPDEWNEWARLLLAGLPDAPPSAPLPPGTRPAEHRMVVPPADYRANVVEAQRYLRDGESYELCLTTQFLLDEPVEPVSTYLNLRRCNPAPFASFLRHRDLAVLSSSPERFLRIDAGGAVETKPIKGTASRGATPEEDALVAARLAADEKTRAENLMITDLLRNDLGVVCDIGSVHVPALMDVETYATVHQLVTTVRGRLRPGGSVVDCVRAAFPGGSMTGAPKVRSMEILDDLEPSARGLYSGAIGYLSASGPVDLSITIRTIVVDGGRAAIGSGGAIVMASDPDAEVAEVLLKSDVLLRAVGLTQDIPMPDTAGAREGVGP